MYVISLKLISFNVLAICLCITRFSYTIFFTARQLTAPLELPFPSVRSICNFFSDVCSYRSSLADKDLGDN